MVMGTVKFGEDSMVEVCGQGIILFAATGSHHCELKNVYRISRLESNIVNIGQFDEIGYSTHVEHDGARSAKEPPCQGKVSPKHMYTIHL